MSFINFALSPHPSPPPPPPPLTLSTAAPPADPRPIFISPAEPPPPRLTLLSFINFALSPGSSSTPPPLDAPLAPRPSPVAALSPGADTSSPPLILSPAARPVPALHPIFVSPAVPPEQDHGSHKKISSRVTIVVSVIGSVVVIAIVIWLITITLRRRSKSKEDDQEEGMHRTAGDSAPHAARAPQGGGDPAPQRPEGSRSSGELNIPSSQHLGPRRYSYEELRIATDNFSQSKLLGRGGFGLVYKGKLPAAEDGSSQATSQLVAVKCIAENSNQGLKEFQTEVRIISDLRHRHLVRLKGWCYEQEGQYLLVYEFLPNGSLDLLLFNDELCVKLTWERRYSIALGLGSALQYLHEECDSVILHRDIKSSNVLLDDRFNAKLGDFGLSRQMNQGITSHSTKVAGTRGYLAPELFVGSGRATRASDMYAFGAVLLELVCGKRALDDARFVQHGGLLVGWVWQLNGQGRLLDSVDMRLNGQLDREEAERMLVVGLACSHPDAEARPNIRRALEILLKTVAVLPVLPPSKPTLAYMYGSPPPQTISQVLHTDSATGSSSYAYTTASDSTTPSIF